MSAEAKTEAPTPKRLSDAQKRGQAPRARLLGAAASWAGAALGWLALAPGAWSRLTTSALELDPSRVIGSLSAALAPVLAAVSGAAVLQALVLRAAQGGPLAWQALRLDLARLRPRLERFAGKEALRGCGQQLAWLVVMGGAIALGVDPHRPLVPAWTRWFGVAGAALAVLSIPDLWLGRRAWAHGLRMSLRDVRDETKSTDGNPEMKGRRRALARAVVSQGEIRRRVGSAKIVVVNPTHIAVALAWDPREAEAPVVVAKGRGRLAARVRSAARAAEVPLAQSVPLARALFATEVDEPIPPELYAPVAELLGYLLAPSRADPASPRAGG